MPIEISPSKFAYGSAAIALLGALGGLSMGGFWGFLSASVGGLGAIIAVLLYKYGYYIIPAITKFTNVVQVTDTGYEIPPSQDVILLKSGNIYYATAFLGVNIFESAIENTQEQNIIYSEYFERAISTIKYAAKYSMMVYVKDISDYRMKVETKRAEIQLKLSREREKPDPDVLKIDRYEKELSMWNAEVQKLSRGYKPMAAVAYVMTTATGITKEAAVASVRNQASELRSVISNAMNVEIAQLSGDEMLRCFEWEYMLPTTIGALKAKIE